MAWFTRFTRFGDVHMVYAQEAVNSCGIASVMMCVFKINKLVPGPRALYAEQEIYKVYGSAAATTYDGSAYSYASHLATTLNKLNVGSWKAERLGMADVPGAIMGSVGEDVVGAGPIVNGVRRGNPVIVLVGWSGSGAHFVVVDTVNNFLGSLYASVCDPHDGDVHITAMEKGKDFKYVPQPNFGSWDLGGKRGEYSGPKTGQANGWIIRQT